MNGSDLNSFPLEARKNKRVILENMALLFSEPRVRASREKIISNPTVFIGSKLGFKMNLHFFKKTLFVFVASLLFFGLHAEEDFHFKIVDEVIGKYRQRHQVPGVAVILYYEGVPYFFSFGLANLMTRAPVTLDTIFELGSITKSFTAILLALEALKGTVRLNDRAELFLPGLHGFNGPFSEVTLLQLATHTAGFPHDVSLKLPSYAQAIQYLKNWSPSYPIGTHYQYSNFGFGLLGLALESASRKKYVELLSLGILGPLQMNRTFIYVPESLSVDYAQGYKKNGSPAPRWPITLIAAAGALRSTAGDMTKFLAACLNLPGTPIQLSKAIELTETIGFRINSQRTQVMSWMKTEHEGYTIFAKNGGVTGFSTFMGYIPEYKTGIVILANKNANNTAAGQNILQRLGDRLTRMNRPVKKIEKTLNK